MHTELADVKRCDRCGAVVSALWLSTYDCGDAEYWREPIPHSLADCDRVRSISREEWPAATRTY